MIDPPVNISLMLSRDSTGKNPAPPKPSSRRVRGAVKNCTPLLELALKGGKPQKIGQLLKANDLFDIM